MNKKEMVDALAAKSGMTKTDSKKALDTMLEVIGETLKNGESVSLVGFGNFSVVERPERKGVNPATKEAITIPAKKVVKFKAGAGLV